jgi:hypothetical protein
MVWPRSRQFVRSICDCQRHRYLGTYAGGRCLESGRTMLPLSRFWQPQQVARSVALAHIYLRLPAFFSQSVCASSIHRPYTPLNPQQLVSPELTRVNAITMNKSISVQSPTEVDDKVCFALSVAIAAASVAYATSADTSIGPSETVFVPPPSSRDSQPDLPILPRESFVTTHHPRSRPAITYPRQPTDPFRSSPNLLRKQSIPDQHPSQAADEQT